MSDQSHGIIRAASCFILFCAAFKKYIVINQAFFSTHQYLENNTYISLKITIPKNRSLARYKMSISIESIHLILYTEPMIVRFPGNLFNCSWAAYWSWKKKSSRLPAPRTAAIRWCRAALKGSSRRGLTRLRLGQEEAYGGGGEPKWGGGASTHGAW